MKTIMHIRACEVCGKSIAGRADKKFCSDWCRNAHNNARKTELSPAVRRINNILLKNYALLKDLRRSPERRRRITRTALASAGFIFGYHTHTSTNRKGRTVFWCYDTGYSTPDDVSVTVVALPSSFAAV